MEDFQETSQEYNSFTQKTKIGLFKISIIS